MRAAGDNVGVGTSSVPSLSTDEGRGGTASGGAAVRTAPFDGDSPTPCATSDNVAGTVVLSWLRDCRSPTWPTGEGCGQGNLSAVLPLAACGGRDGWLWGGTSTAESISVGEP